MATLKSALVAALSILLLGLVVPVLVAGPASAACVTMDGDPCQTARQYRRAFNRGDLGNSRVTKSKWPRAFKVKLRRVVTRKGLIPPARSSRRLSRASYRYSDWGDYWTAFNNALDCVAPGAESSCKKDFGTIRALKEPAKVVVGCGGLAVAAFYTAGTAPVAAGVSGGLTCGWGLAIASW